MTRRHGKSRCVSVLTSDRPQSKRSYWIRSTLDSVLFSDYRRHHANVRATVAGLLETSKRSAAARPRRQTVAWQSPVPAATSPTTCVPSSGGHRRNPCDDRRSTGGCITRLAADAKITPQADSEQRMNGSCRGGRSSTRWRPWTRTRPVSTDGQALPDLVSDRFTLMACSRSDLQADQRRRGKPDLAASVLRRRRTDHRRLASGRPIRQCRFLGGRCSSCPNRRNLPRPRRQRSTSSSPVRHLCIVRRLIATATMTFAVTFRHHRRTAHLRADIGDAWLKNTGRVRSHAAAFPPGGSGALTPPPVTRACRDGSATGRTSSY